jgi:hypothetical protein
MGVWGLRLEALGLVLIVIGLLVALGAHDAGLWTVVAGLAVVGTGAVFTIVGMVSVYRDFGAERPSDDLLRRALARDVVGLDRRGTQAGAPASSTPSGGPGTT